MTDTEPKCTTYVHVNGELIACGGEVVGKTIHGCIHEHVFTNYFCAVHYADMLLERVRWCAPCMYAGELGHECDIDLIHIQEPQLYG